MDAMCGCNAVGNKQGGFAPGVAPFDPSQGLAMNRLGGPLLGQGLGMPDSSALLSQSMQMQTVMLQMMSLLLGLMMGGGQANAAQNQSGGGTPPVDGASGGGISSPNTNASAANGQAPANETKDVGEIKGFIEKAAAAYGTDPKVLTEVARRESNFQTGAVNDWDSNAKKGTPSKGLFQFIEPTFKSYAAQAKKANPQAWEGLGELNWLDWRQQALAAAWAIKNGHGSAWSTYKAAGGT